MRRTILSALACACTAVLAASVPAFADGTTPSPVPSTARIAGQGPSPVPSTPAGAPSPVPGEVSVVPSGAPDTGVVPEAGQSGGEGGLIGGSAAAVIAAGGAAVFLIRRRWVTGA